MLVMLRIYYDDYSQIPGFWENQGPGRVLGSGFRENLGVQALLAASRIRGVAVREIPGARPALKPRFWENPGTDRLLNSGFRKKIRQQPICQTLIICRHPNFYNIQNATITSNSGFRENPHFFPIAFCVWQGRRHKVTTLRSGRLQATRGNPGGLRFPC